MLNQEQSAESWDRIKGFISNRLNAIPYDPKPPRIASGLRFGTPAMTTRGFKEKESAHVAELMLDTLENRDNDEKKKEIRDEIVKISQSFPIPESFV